MPAFEMDFNWGSMSPPFGGEADWLLQVNSAASGPLPSGLRQVPEQVACKRCPQQGSAVTAEIDDLVQMFDLQAVVERVAKPVRPVEQRKRAQHKQIDSRSRMSDQSHDALVRGRLDPPQRKRQAPEEKMHRNQERGHYAARTEQSPEERLDPHLRLFLHHLTSQQEPGYHSGDGHPRRVVGAHNQKSGDALSREADRHRAR